jgi:RNA polymerase sigma-70 factor (ECF subfamily)
MSLLAPEVTWTADSGGKASAARRPVIGADKVARILVGMFRFTQRMTDIRIEMANCNNSPAMVVYSGDTLEGVFLVEVVDGKITNFYAMRNPDKLSGIAVPRAISR